MSRRILLVNPNSTEAMTEAVKSRALHLGYDNAQSRYHCYTAPSGPRSIDNDADARESSTHCLPDLVRALKSYDGILVACYSQHPLVPALKKEARKRGFNVYVTGIFEASITTALQIIAPDEQFGIVSTGKVWKDILPAAISDFLGVNQGTSTKFAGIETTGLSAVELHETSRDEVDRRLKAATKHLLGRGKIGAICLGCAGMAGMTETVREACVEELGSEKGRRVKIIDGIEAGVAWLEGVVRSDN